MKQLYPSVRLFLFVFAICIFSGLKAQLSLSITSQINPTCSNTNNGSATATVSGGTGPYTYSWSPSGGTNATANNLFAGAYTCIVTDQSNMTTATASVILTAQSNLHIS